MKTTIEIPNPLFKKAKDHAMAHKTTLKWLIEQGLQTVLSTKPVQNPCFKLGDKSVGGKGLQSDLDWHNWSQIRNLAYKGRGT